jgi:hypothetical protein
MNGLLAETNAHIRQAEARHRREKAERERLRRPNALIDRLQQELEELNLKGMKRVPLSYEERLRELVTLLPSSAAIASQLDNLKVKVGIGRLMDALFDIQAALFIERNGRAYELDPEEFGSDLIPAA